MTRLRPAAALLASLAAAAAAPAAAHVTLEVQQAPANSTYRAVFRLPHGCEGAQVRTLEGLNHTPRVRALQRAFTEAGAFQCGFCTPGMLVAAEALLSREPAPDEAAVRRALSGNLCRCTGYVTIVQAVRAAAAALRAESAA